MNTVKKIGGILLVAIVIIIAAITSWRWAHVDEHISPYKQSDHEAIVTILMQDWSILVAEGSEFSPEYMLDHLAADSHYPDHSLSIMVYREEGKPVGFVTYHALDGFHGRIQFLAMARGYRGKGYGRKLMQYAMEDMRSRGICFVELVTRISNEPARALYHKLGFVERWYEGDFVGFSVSLCSDVLSAGVA